MKKALGYIIIAIILIALAVDIRSLNHKVEKMNKDCNTVLMDNFALSKELVKLKEDVATMLYQQKLGK